jgi:hypothetical protein
MKLVKIFKNISDVPLTRISSVAGNNPVIQVSNMLIDAGKQDFSISETDKLWGFNTPVGYKFAKLYNDHIYWNNYMIEKSNFLHATAGQRGVNTFWYKLDNKAIGFNARTDKHLTVDLDDNFPWIINWSTGINHVDRLFTDGKYIDIHNLKVTDSTDNKIHYTTGWSSKQHTMGLYDEHDNMCKPEIMDGRIIDFHNNRQDLINQLNCFDKSDYKIDDRINISSAISGLIYLLKNAEPDN